MTFMVKATSKGQITLPAAWRKSVETNHFLVKERKGVLEISPVNMDDLDEKNWTTIFDAERDNNGKGVPADVFLAALKKARAKKYGRA